MHEGPALGPQIDGTIVLAPVKYTNIRKVNLWRFPEMCYTENRECNVKIVLICLIILIEMLAFNTNSLLLQIGQNHKCLTYLCHKKFKNDLINHLVDLSSLHSMLYCVYSMLPASPAELFARNVACHGILVIYFSVFKIYYVQC